MNRYLVRLFLCLAASFSFISAFGQCVPGTFSQPGLYPQVLPDGVEGKPYTDTTLTLVFLPDTTVTIPTETPGVTTQVNIVIDKIIIEELGGLPQGMNFSACNQAGCIYTINPNIPSSWKACVKVSGMPTIAGVYGVYAKFAVEGHFVMPFDYPSADPVLIQGQTYEIQNLPPSIIDTLLAHNVDPEERRRIKYESLLTVINVPDFCNTDSLYINGGLNPREVRVAQVNQNYTPVFMSLDFPTSSKLPISDTEIADVTFENFTIDQAGGPPPGMKFEIDDCLFPTPCVIPVGTGLPNRYCFELTGTPMAAGEYFPFIRFIADGTATINGQTVSLATGLPAEFQGMRTFTFNTYIRVEPTPTNNPCFSPHNILSAGLYPDTMPDGNQYQNYNGGTAYDLTVKLPTSGSLNQSFNNKLIRGDMVYTGFIPDSSRRMPKGMAINNLNIGTQYNVSHVDESKMRLCLTASGTPTESGDFEPNIYFKTDGFIKLDNFYVRLSALPSLFNRYKTYRPNTKLKINASSSRNDLAQQMELTLAPNPTTGESTLNYQLAAPTDLKLTIVDATGRVVADFPTERQNAGVYQRQLDLRRLPNGLYWAQIQTEAGQTGLKIVLSR